MDPGEVHRDVLAYVLNERAQLIASEWGIALGAPFASSPWSYVAAAGEHAVLKVRAEDDLESDHDLDALLRWDGQGAVRVLRHDRERRAMLLERARPGDDLAALPEDEALRVALGVSRQLWVPAGPPFRSVHAFIPGWLSDVNASAQVRQLYESLGTRADTLVHGDLHHHNILRDVDRWAAIDSKAMLCEPEFDVAPLLWNPIGSIPSRSGIQRCLDVFTEAGLDRARMRAWALIRATYLERHDAAALLV